MPTQTQIIDQFSLTVLSPEEIYNRTAATNPERNYCIHRLFEIQVEKNGKAPAVIHEGRTLNYQTLNDQANKIAHYLIQIGVTPETRVGLCADHGSMLIAALLGILKAGGTYVPLDPKYAAHQLTSILADASPLYLIADARGQSVLKVHRLPVLDIDKQLPLGLTTFNPQIPKLGLTSAHLAYIMYTFGSTGVPRGVMVEHRQSTSVIIVGRDVFGFQKEDNWCLFHSLTCSFSTWQIMGALSNGSPLAIMSYSIGHSAYLFYEYICQHGITVLNLSPSAFKVFTQAKISNLKSDKLRLVILIEEALDSQILKIWNENIYSEESTVLVSIYGPIEAQLSYYKLKPTKNSISTGRPFPDVRSYLLDAQRKHVEFGAAGELYISSPAVARGYLNHHRFSQESFFADPYRGLGSQMYRTGDRAKYLPDGSLICLGHNDHQIPIRGFRIDRGEMETKLIQHSRGSKVVIMGPEGSSVLIRGNGLEKSLIAYVCAETNSICATDLKRYLTLKLSEYMVPMAFIHSSIFPLKPRCEIDYQSQSALDGNAYGQNDYEEPLGEWEEKLASSWCSLLNLDQVSRNDNFFALGGHSLLVNQMLSQLPEMGLSVCVRAVYEAPTLAALVDAIEDYTAVVIPVNLIDASTANINCDMLPLILLSQDDIDRVVGGVPGGVCNVQDIYSLTPLQQGILFHSLIAKEEDPYLLELCLHFKNVVVLSEYVCALQHVMQRHDSLRTAFIWEDTSEPAQVVWRCVPSILVEVSRCDSIKNFVAEFNPDSVTSRNKMDLTKAPLVCFGTSSKIDGTWEALQVMHHLIFDHSSLDTMFSEVYLIFSQRMSEILETPVPFRNLVAKTCSGVQHSEHILFFSDMLGDIEAPTYPFRFCDVHCDGKDINEFKLVLSHELNDTLRTHAKWLKVSLATLCHLAFARFLSSSCGIQTVVFGTVLFGRSQGGKRNTNGIGLWLNTLPLRVDIGNTTIEEAVYKTHSNLSALLAHEHASLVVAEKCCPIAGARPLFSALLNFRHQNKHDRAHIPGIEIVYARERTNYPLNLSLEDYHESLGVAALVLWPVSSQHVCSFMQHTLDALSKALARKPSQIMKSLSVMPQTEQRLLIETWNQSGIVYENSNSCIHKIFQTRVEICGDLLALEFEGVMKNYRELSREADLFAEYLICLGVTPETRVALCISRGCNLIVALLSILKSGGSYVPLDPIYRCERLNQILNDAHPMLLLSDSENVRKFCTHSIPLINIEVIIHSRLHTYNPRLSSVNIAPSNLAYIIYTSGSTGVPKGVMIEHQMVVQLVDVTRHLFEFNCQNKWCLFFSYAFDGSVMDIWGALLTGGQLGIISNDTIRTTHKFYEWVCNFGLTVLNITPSAFKMYLEVKMQNSLSDGLKYVILAGETVDPTLRKMWHHKYPKSNTIFYNLFGCTEATVVSVFHAMNDDNLYSPIGRPLRDVKIYLLDPVGDPTPFGATGEIYLGGGRISRGYVNRPEQSAEHFLPNHFESSDGKIMYCTGDLGYYLPNGNLMYLGRKDNQVKIRGYRIETAEIEKCLIEHPQVKGALVLQRDNGLEKNLVAYIIFELSSMCAKDLRKYVSVKLPEYMVPTAFVFLSEFPLTPNGKLDYKSLPAPDENAYAHNVYEAPHNEWEEELANIWCTLLGLDYVSRNDNFFALGGHSLLVVHMLSQLRQSGLNVCVRVVFEAPTLAKLADALHVYQPDIIPSNQIDISTMKIFPDMLPLIRLTQNDIGAIVDSIPGGVLNIEDIYRLSPLQQGMILHHLTSINDDLYQVKLNIHFQNIFVLKIYLDALEVIIQRHGILRTTFIWEDINEPAQVVWRQVPSILIENWISGTLRINEPNLIRSKFDLTEAPLIHLEINSETNGELIALQKMHHLVFDKSSIDILFEEMEAIICEHKDVLPSPVPFRNFVANASFGSSAEEHTKFFSEMLADIDEPTYPFSLSNNEMDVSDTNESHIDDLSELNDKLCIQAMCLKVSLASILHLAFARFLSSSSGSRSVVFGTVLLGRMHGGVSNAKGFGLWLNTLPLRLNIGETGVEEAVREAHCQLSSLLAHEHALLALAQRCSSVGQSQSLFSALFNLRSHQSCKKFHLPGVNLISSEGRTNYPLLVAIDNYRNRLELTIQVKKPVSSVKICVYMKTILESLSKALIFLPSQPIQTLTIVPESEHKFVLQKLNQNSVAHRNSDFCIQQLFELQAKEHGDRIALEFQDKLLRYKELHEESNKLAHYLICVGVKPNARVALCVSRGVELIVTLLGILKSGAAYVPLDPAHHSERLSQILYDAQPLLLLTDSENLRELCSHKIPIANVEVIIRLVPFTCNLQMWRQKITSSNLAYILYTSGSTGVPKGVMIEHQMVVDLFDVTCYKFDFHHEDKWCLFSSYAFDVSVWEIWGALLFGGQLGIISYNTSRSTHTFYEWVCNFGLTILNQTPSAYKMYLEVQMNSSLSDCVRYLILAGEAVDTTLINMLYRRSLDSDVNLYNLYGCTEATIHSTIYKINEMGFSRSIGRPLPDVSVYLLDSTGDPVPFGATGEIYLSGDRISCGYVNRPEQSAKHFLPDHFDGNTGKRMYRTGDLGYSLPDGNLIYIGRKDNQIKIRGYRIEAGEIEACLIEHPHVDGVLLVPRDNGSEKSLVAYIISERNSICATDLRSHVSSKLPEYMVPSAFIHVSMFPLTPNGKLDYKSLPAPDENAYAHNDYEAPQGEWEEKLAYIWCSLLNLDNVSRNDNFFALGGHSLLVIQMISQLHQLGLNVSVRAVFEAPTLAALAATMEDYKTAVIPVNLIGPLTAVISPDMLPLIILSQDDIDTIVGQVPGCVSNVQDIYSLTPLQQGILFHNLMAKGVDPYLLELQLHFRDAVVLATYFSALQHVMQRHDALRTAFIWEDIDEPAQVVWRFIPSILVEVSQCQIFIAEFDSDSTISHNKIDLTKAPLICFDTSQKIDGSWEALQVMHHIILDHFSMDVLFSEINVIISQPKYSSEALKKRVSFRNLVAQVCLGVSSAQHTQFFSDMLGDIKESTYPFHLCGVHCDGKDINEFKLRLSNELNDNLRTHAQRFKVSLATLCHLAFAKFLSSSSGIQTVVFGTVLFGRSHQGGERNASGIGLWLNTLPVRIDIDSATVEDAVYKMHSQLSSLLVHEHASLALAGKCAPMVGAQVLFSALLNFRHQKTTELIHLPGIDVLYSRERTNYPLSLSVEDYHKSLGLTALVLLPVLSQNVCNYMQHALVALSRALSRNLNQVVQSLNIMPQAEVRLLIGRANCESEIVPKNSDRCIHEIFETQAERRGDLLALEFEGIVKNYCELNREADLLAEYLICLGVKPETRVALCISRGCNLIVALLSILKSGGAYIPLDPVYCSERLNQILNDAQPMLLLGDLENVRKLGTHNVPVMDINAPLQVELPSQNAQSRGVNVAPTNLAYVMYTSGSTGVPKGVMIEHKMVVSLFDVTRQQFDFRYNDKWCLFSSYAFDISVWEIWGALFFGGQLGIVSYITSRSTHNFCEWVANFGITILNQTPSVFRMYLEVKVNNSLPDRLRYLFLAGEVVDPSAVSLWYSKHMNDNTILYNMYGPTEATVYSTVHIINKIESASSIGRPLPGMKVYLLDSVGEPVPFGATGEIYLSGDRISRGYMNRSNLSAEHFLPDHFARSIRKNVYCTGDLAYYLPDGNLMYIGRKDNQIKIRGYRVETAEIEKCLIKHVQVNMAVVITKGSGLEKCLLAYIVSESGPVCAKDLRRHVTDKLPQYMVPAAYIHLKDLPVTPNGKLDCRSLPEPDADAYAYNDYEEPCGEWEEKLANIWRSLLGVHCVSRNDNFFALGGHSLLVVQMLSRLRQLGLNVCVQVVFEAPTFAKLADALYIYQPDIIPSNKIDRFTVKIIPDMLPLIRLTQSDIDTIVDRVPGGVLNIEDVYRLSPLQQGMIFHHLTATGAGSDEVILNIQFQDNVVLEKYTHALGHVIERHQILRTTFLWEDVSEPAQVVWQQVPSLKIENQNSGSDSTNELNSKYYKVDLACAPLIRLEIALDTNGQLIAVQKMHHLIFDKSSMDILFEEIEAIVREQKDTLSFPVPFRNLVAQASFDISSAEHSRFFSEMLADINEPTYPFSLSNVKWDGSEVNETSTDNLSVLNDALRFQAQRLKVSLACLFHVAFAKFLSNSSGCRSVVFGTVLLGRMLGGESNARGFGLWLNTLPLKLNMDETPVEDSVHEAHSRLSSLLVHEHASLALAQRCSSIGQSQPLFSALFNFRSQQSLKKFHLPGVRIISSSGQTNYPLSVAIDLDHGGLQLTVQVNKSVSSDKVCVYLKTTLESLSKALVSQSNQRIQTLTVLPESEYRSLIQTWNRPLVAHNISNCCIHQIFETQTERCGDTYALEFQGKMLSYRELNEEANLLAHYMIRVGVKTETRVALFVSRGLNLIIAILSILKSGGAYVPLDPAHHSKRLNQILNDAQPILLLADLENMKKIGTHNVPVINVEVILKLGQHVCKPQMKKLNTTPLNLAHIMYTSGSTGAPKGVMIEHKKVIQLFDVTHHRYGFNHQDKWCLFSSYGFDVSVWEIWGALLYGGQLGIISQRTSHSADDFCEWLCHFGVTVLNQTPSAFKILLEVSTNCPLSDVLRHVNLGGEAVSESLISLWHKKYPESSTIFHNMYGCTEATIVSTIYAIEDDYVYNSIGRPLPDVTVYLLDQNGDPVPLAATGEIYLGGERISRGYINRPEETVRHFLPDHFESHPGKNMYRTGDLAYYLPNGNLMYAGRSDNQIKIRGYRIEMAEIEKCLIEYPNVEGALVVPRGSGLEKCLVAYIISKSRSVCAKDLRRHMSFRLPECMVPIAYVHLSEFPLTPNGKLDHKRLPPPDKKAYAHNDYEEPQGEWEEKLSNIWCSLLSLDHVSRNDNFFALGGHSLLVIQMLSQLHQLGLNISVYAVFEAPTLASLVDVMEYYTAVKIPDNLISASTKKINPDMLPLIILSQDDIDTVVKKVPGSVTNVQDIYSLTPLQKGILFHSLTARDWDPYLLECSLHFRDSKVYSGYLDALHHVTQRHDALRTGFIWEDIEEPAQVVWRLVPPIMEDVLGCASESCTQSEFIHDNIAGNLKINLTQAPLICLKSTLKVDGGWEAVQVMHHLILDHSSWDLLFDEIEGIFSQPENKKENLAAPIPFRNLVAQVCLGVSHSEHTEFFSEMLGNIDSPAYPFRLSDIHCDGNDINEFKLNLSPSLNDMLRTQAKRLKVSLASFCHLAFARLLSCSSEIQTVVFGTVLFGRSQGGKRNTNGIGLWLNTLPLRVDTGNTTVEEAVYKTHSGLSALLAHEHASLALAEKCTSFGSSQPLFSALLNFRHQKSRELIFLPGIDILYVKERTNYPLNLSVENHYQSLGVTVLVKLPVLAHQICGYMQHTLNALSEALVGNPTQIMHSLSIMPPTEQRSLIEMWNRSETVHEISNCCIHELFENQLEVNGDLIALEFEGEKRSYVELNGEADLLSLYLICVGARPNTRVAVCISRGLNLIVALLSILKSGGAYVPLDPAHSSQRLNQILIDAKPILLLTDLENINKLGEHCVPVINVELTATLTINTSTNLRMNQNVTPSNIAYIMYTSGSTGVPKGVMIDHKMVTQLFDVTCHQFGFNHQDIWCLFSSYAFDFSVWEIWGALLYGGQLGIVSYYTSRSTQTFYEWVCNFGLTVFCQTPSAFKMYLEVQMNSPLTDGVRCVILGGETVDSTVVNMWHTKNIKRSTILYNMYGCTEATVHSTVHTIDKIDFANSIGRPLADVKIYLLDSVGEPVPLGATGEMYLSSDRISRGYINRPEQSAEHFLPDHFEGRTARCMYRTGDLAYHLPDGNLSYVGRKDNQIKIRGHRIETGEIEKCLVEHLQVKVALVVLKDRNLEKSLVAYIIPKGNSICSKDLRRHVSLKLPEYMVPTAYIHLSEFPLTSNGKLDLKSLPAPDSSSYAHNDYEAPQGEWEEILACIWCSLLNLDQVSRYDNFFALGGHSLLVVQMLSRLRQSGVDVNIRVVFEAPTLASLAGALHISKPIYIPSNLINTATVTISPNLLPLIRLTQNDIDGIIDRVPGGVVNIQDVYSLAPLQQGIVFHHLTATKRDPYELKINIHFQDESVLGKYSDALQCIIKRHEILRTSFLWEDVSESAQIVWRQVPSVLIRNQIARTDSIDQLNLINDLKIDLAQAPLVRLECNSEINGGVVGWQKMHHLVFDESSMDILLEEMEAIVGEHKDLLPAPVPFRNMVALYSADLSTAEHTQFFSEMLGNIDEPTYPFSLSSIKWDTSETNETCQDNLSEELIDTLRFQAVRLKVSFACLFHLAFARFLSSSSGCSSVVFGTVLLGRMHGGESSSARGFGLWLNTLPLRLNVDETPVEEAVSEAHWRLSSLLSHEHASLAMAQRCSHVGQSQPLFSALFNFRSHQYCEKIHLPGVSILSSKGQTNYPLSVTLDNYHGRLALSVQVEKPVSSDMICVYMKKTLESLSKALALRPNQQIQTLTVAPASERRLMMQTWSRSFVARGISNHCIQQLYEIQAEEHSDKVALECRGEILTYKELNEEANQLAHYMICVGVKPETRVALCVTRGFKLIAIILGILKSGGSYVPLDPAHQSERLNQILNDAQPMLLFTDSENLRKLDTHNIPVINVEATTHFEPHTDNPQLREAATSNLAYIMYTSGSTGVPKGVMIEHRMVVQLFDATRNQFDFHRDDKWCLFSSYAFDFSVWEIWGSLLSGGQLGIIPHNASHSTQKFYEWVCNFELTILNQTPSAFKMFSDMKMRSSLSDKIRYILLGGETVDEALINLWYTKYPDSNTIFYNMYGCTETTVISTIYVLEHGKLCTSIGRPLPDVKIYLLDSIGDPVPLQATGELYLGGSRISRGYTNRAEQSAHHFLPDFFERSSEAFVYRTGDLAYYTIDGNLMYVGRKDSQTKVRGHRIETAEIKACLIDHPWVKDAVVVARGDGSMQVLVAYIVSNQDEILAYDLRKYLVSRLPDYMIPAAFVQLPSLPLTINGKLDQLKLPTPESGAFAHQTYEAPQGELEEIIAKIWAILLGVRKCSRHDNFFELGGNSLSAIQFSNRAKQRRIGIETQDLFLYPVLKDLATYAVLQSSQASDFAIPVRRSGDGPPLFLLPTVYDHSYAFALAELIDSSFPVYALPCISLPENQPQSIEDIAVRMVYIMKQIQPHGPFLIVGYSAGGILAYEIANQLVQSLDRVLFVGLIDTYPPAAFYRTLSCKSEFVLLFILNSNDAFLHLLDNDIWWSYLKSTNFEEATATMKSFCAPMKISDGEMEKLIHKCKQLLQYQNIIERYKVDLLPLRVTLFKAKSLQTDGHVISSSHLREAIQREINLSRQFYSLPKLGWEHCLSELNFNVITVEGDHRTIIEDPKNRTLLAARINQALIEATST